MIISTKIKRLAIEQTRLLAKSDNHMINKLIHTNDNFQEKQILQEITRISKSSS